MNKTFQLSHQDYINNGYDPSTGLPRKTLAELATERYLVYKQMIEALKLYNEANDRYKEIEKQINLKLDEMVIKEAN